MNVVFRLKKLNALVVATAVFLMLHPASSIADTEDPTNWETPPAPTSITVPVADADGAYTVSWSIPGWNRPGTWTYQLYERRNGGAWVRVYNFIFGYTNLSGRTSAEYEYRVRGCNDSSWCGPFSSIATTIVETGPWPEPMPLDEQLN